MIEVLVPAPIGDVQAVLPGRRRLQRLAFFQAQRSETVSLRQAGEPVAVAMLFPEGPKVRELCLLFLPDARSAMLRLVRIAQLMLRPLAEDGVVVLARIDPRNVAGRRMARAAGFLETDAESGWLWLWR